MFLHLSDSVHRREVSASGSRGGVHPLGRHPTRRTPLPPRRPLDLTVCIMLECILVSSDPGKEKFKSLCIAGRNLKVSSSNIERVLVR